jgi:hypothetical protein
MQSRFDLKFRMTTLAIILSFTAQEAAQAAPSMPSLFQAALPMPRMAFRLPDSVAVIEDGWTAPAAKDPKIPVRMIILIQDAHTNDSAQMNLAHTLHTILPAEGIKHVFAEAAQGDVSLTYLKSQYPRPALEQAARQFVRKGLIKGSEYLNVSSEEDFVIWGVEDKQLYDEAVLAYQAQADSRQKALAFISRAQSSLEELKSENASEAYLKLDRLQAGYAEGKVMITAYLDGLKKAFASDRRIGLPALEKLEKLRARESRLDFAKIAEEQRAAIAELAPSDREELGPGDAQQASPFSFKPGSAASTPRGFYTLLEEKLKKSGVSARRYPELFRYFAYLKSARKFDAPRALRELEAFEAAAFAEVAKSREEKWFAILTKNLRSWRSMLELKMTPEDYARYQADKELFDLDVICGFVNGLIAKSKRHYDRALATAGETNAARTAAERFYDLTFQRDHAFMEKLTSKMDADRIQKAVLITGGYHAANLKGLLRQKGYSYISIIPQVTHETDHARYERLLLAQAGSIQKDRTALAKSAPGADATSHAIDTEYAVVTGQAARLAATAARLASYDERVALERAEREAGVRAALAQSGASLTADGRRYLIDGKEYLPSHWPLNGVSVGIEVREYRRDAKERETLLGGHDAADPNTFLTGGPLVITPKKVHTSQDFSRRAPVGTIADDPRSRKEGFFKPGDLVAFDRHAQTDKPGGGYHLMSPMMLADIGAKSRSERSRGASGAKTEYMAMYVIRVIGEFVWLGHIESDGTFKGWMIREPWANAALWKLTDASAGSLAPIENWTYMDTRSLIWDEWVQVGWKSKPDEERASYLVQLAQNLHEAKTKWQYIGQADAILRLYNHNAKGDRMKYGAVRAILQNILAQESSSRQAKMMGWFLETEMGKEDHVRSAAERRLSRLNTSQSRKLLKVLQDTSRTARRHQSDSAARMAGLKELYDVRPFGDTRVPGYISLLLERHEDIDDTPFNMVRIHLDETKLHPLRRNNVLQYYAEIGNLISVTFEVTTDSRHNLKDLKITRQASSLESAASVVEWLTSMKDQDKPKWTVDAVRRFGLGARMADFGSTEFFALLGIVGAALLAVRLFAHHFVEKHIDNGRLDQESIDQAIRMFALRGDAVDAYIQYASGTIPRSAAVTRIRRLYNFDQTVQKIVDHAGQHRSGSRMASAKKSTDGNFGTFLANQEERTLTGRVRSRLAGARLAALEPIVVETLVFAAGLLGVLGLGFWRWNVNARRAEIEEEVTRFYVAKGDDFFFAGNEPARRAVVARAVFMDTQAADDAIRIRRIVGKRYIDAVTAAIDQAWNYPTPEKRADEARRLIGLTRQAVERISRLHEAAEPYKQSAGEGRLVKSPIDWGMDWNGFVSLVNDAAWIDDEGHFESDLHDRAIVFQPAYGYSGRPLELAARQKIEFRKPGSADSASSSAARMAIMQEFAKDKERALRLGFVRTSWAGVSAGLFFAGVSVFTSVPILALAGLAIAGVFYKFHSNFIQAEQHFNADADAAGISRLYGFWTRHWNMRHEHTISLKMRNDFKTEARKTADISEAEADKRSNEEILAAPFDNNQQELPVSSDEPSAAFWYPRWYEDRSNQELRYAFPNFRKSLSGLPNDIRAGLLFFARDLSTEARNDRMAMTVRNLDSGALAQSHEFYAASDIYFDILETLQILSSAGVVVPERFLGEKLFFPDWGSVGSTTRDGFNRFTINPPLFDYIRKILDPPTAAARMAAESRKPTAGILKDGISWRDRKPGYFEVGEFVLFDVITLAQPPNASMFLSLSPRHQPAGTHYVLGLVTAVEGDLIRLDFIEPSGDLMGAGTTLRITYPTLWKYQTRRAGYGALQAPPVEPLNIGYRSGSTLKKVVASADQHLTQSAYERLKSYAKTQGLRVSVANKRKGTLVIGPDSSKRRIMDTTKHAALAAIAARTWVAEREWYDKETSGARPEVWDKAEGLAHLLDPGTVMDRTPGGQLRLQSKLLASKFGARMSSDIDQPRIERVQWVEHPDGGLGLNAAEQKQYADVAWEAASKVDGSTAESVKLAMLFEPLESGDSERLFTAQVSIAKNRLTIHRASDLMVTLDAPASVDAPRPWNDLLANASQRGNQEVADHKTTLASHPGLAKVKLDVLEDLGAVSAAIDRNDELFTEYVKGILSKLTVARQAGSDVRLYLPTDGITRREHLDALDRQLKVYGFAGEESPVRKTVITPEESRAEGRLLASSYHDEAFKDRAHINFRQKSPKNNRLPADSFFSTVNSALDYIAGKAEAAAQRGPALLNALSQGDAAAMNAIIETVLDPSVGITADRADRIKSRLENFIGHTAAQLDAKVRGKERFDEHETFKTPIYQISAAFQLLRMMRAAVETAA